MPQSGVSSMQRSNEGRLPPKVVLHQRLSPTEGCLPPQVVFRWSWRLSFTKGGLPPNVVFHQRSSSTAGCIPPKVVFHRRSCSTEVQPPPKVVFHRRSSTIPHGWYHICESSQHTKSQPPTCNDAWCNTLVDLICENSQHTKSQPPTLLRDCLKFFGQTHVGAALHHKNLLSDELKSKISGSVNEKHN